MAVARYQKPELKLDQLSHSITPLRTTAFFASKLRYANLDAATGEIAERTVKML
jgi:hypothetical protein